MNLKTVVAALFLLAPGGVAWELAPAAIAGAVPEIEKGVATYRFKVGQALTYSFSSELKSKRSARREKGTWKVWVVRKNDDGSWRLVLRQSLVLSEVNRRRTRDLPERVSMIRCDILPDGEIRFRRTTNLLNEPTDLFPRLPRDAAAAKAGWEFSDPDVGATHRYRLASSSTPGEWTIQYEPTSLYERVYERSSKAVIHFSIEKGYPVRIERKNRHDHGFVGSGGGEIILESESVLDGAELKTFAGEVEVYFEARDKYMELFLQAYQGAGNIDPLLDSGGKILDKVRDQVTVDFFRDGIAKQSKEHKRLAKYLRRRAERKAKVLGKPSPNWVAEDFSGRRHSIADYRGRVVILDYWYKGCGFCMRVMPQIVQLAEEFKDQPVTMLGMNTDSREEDARFVIETAGIKYPTIKATKLRKTYDILGFPTLIIIDQRGVVRNIHTGYSPYVREEISKVVKELLARGKQKTRHE